MDVSVPRSRVSLPVSILNYRESTKIQSFPYRDVHGGQLIVAFTKWRTPIISGSGAITALIAEVTIEGEIQGTIDQIKRQVCTRYAGPVIYTFPTWQIYDAITVRARNMAGGHPGLNSVVTAGAGFEMELAISIQPAVRIPVVGEQGEILRGARP
jgi:hypothetical protein